MICLDVRGLEDGASAEGFHEAFLNECPVFSGDVLVKLFYLRCLVVRLAQVYPKFWRWEFVDGTFENRGIRGIL